MKTSSLVLLLISLFFIWLLGVYFFVPLGGLVSSPALQYKAVAPYFIIASVIIAVFIVQRRALKQKRTLTPIELQQIASVRKKPSKTWYLVPFFFGILGGLIAYVGCKYEDERMAKSLLIFGAIWSVVVFIIAYTIILAIIRSASPPY